MIPSIKLHAELGAKCDTSWLGWVDVELPKYRWRVVMTGESVMAILRGERSARRAFLKCRH